MAGPRGVAREVDRELSAHLLMAVDDLIDAGHSPEEAWRIARETFGNHDAIARECRALRAERVRHRRRVEVMQEIWQDLRFAVRGWRRAPGFATVAILTIALGIGANSAIFSAVDSIVLRELPYHEPSRLVTLSFGAGQSISKATLEQLRRRQGAFEQIGAWSRWGFTLTGAGDAESINGVVSTADLFTILGARALIGRTYGPGEDAPGRNMVVVLSHGLWTRRFGADSAVLGRTIQLDVGDGSASRTVIGVMPPGFAFPAAGRDAWGPTSIDPAQANDYSAGYLIPIARLKRTVSFASAGADVRRVVDALRKTDPGQYGPNFGREAGATALRESLVGKVGPALLMLLGAVGFVLLIACVNVANLLLARATARAREIAVRSSLGAGRGRIVRQLLAESLLLALAGGAAGLLLAIWGGRVLGALLPADVPRVGAVGAGSRIFLFGLGTSCVIGFLFGIAPALHLARGALASTLRDGGRGSSAGARGRRTMGALIVGEIALALVLAVGAGLTLQSFWKLRHDDPGFDARGVLTLSVSPPAARYDNADKRAAYYAQLLPRLAAIPGVTHVGAVHLLPFGGSNWNPGLVIEGRTLASGEEWPEVDWRVATPEYFETMRIPLIRGRRFSDVDGINSPGTALVNTALVRRDFPNDDPIGKRVYTFFEGRSNWTTIVGVVGDMKDQALGAPARPQIYRPYAQRPMGDLAIMVRTNGVPSSLAPAVREAVWSLDRNVPIDRVGPLEAVVATSLGQPRLLMVLLGVFGSLAVSLGAIGIYGVISYGVAQRTQEIGVRLALGAGRGDVVRLVVGHALALCVTGLVIGIALALAVTRVLTRQLYGIEATDPVTFVGMGTLLCVVAIAASWIPALRASRVDPTVSLRAG